MLYCLHTSVYEIFAVLVSCEISEAFIRNIEPFIQFKRLLIRVNMRQMCKVRTRDFGVILGRYETSKLIN